ncbi:alpha-keto acid decarboxylase family protein [Actinospica sp. MGRD01-02]|uniref:Alpha-keto-acid decarboxylase n=1 Tax=Actinospica acidithermotolerans TaxID=2828514 RepID=A0A941EMR3_9ACTN|nr:thiamine pyrophosphate-binding protein [Actinospica acidithermotolerans]MBR7830374.1 alpha-keto acid decarboxylase family protein [Actinospica acidithermotolerans]
MTTSTIGDFLLRRLREAGVHQLFGVPGDFNLEFMQQLEDGGVLTWVGTCNELNAAYAADGYARINGIAGLVVTNGVGALSAINGVAGSNSEHVPVVVVCGSLPLKAVDQRLLMHHTPADGSQNTFYRAYEQATAAQARITPQNAVAEIDRLITTAWQLKRPVYLELPSDISYLDIAVPDEPLRLTLPASDPERLRTAAAAIAARLSAAHAPAVILDLDADRFGVLGEVTELAEKLKLPIATMVSSKAVVDETSPLSAGIYGGAGSLPETKKVVEDSDCLLTIGYRRVDLTTGCFSDAIPASAIHLNAYSADVDGVNYQAVTLKDLLRAVIDVAEPVAGRQFGRPAPLPVATNTAPSEGKLTQGEYWAAIQDFVREGDVLIAEDGTANGGAWGLTLPPACTFVTQAVWGSIGYSVGSTLGTLLAAPHRRHLLFLGDGSFQLTAQEISTMLRHDLKPIIFLVNNGGYTIERTILGKTARYNDVANWDYARLPHVLHPGTTARTFTVSTIEEFRKALTAPHDAMIFIEAIMDRFDTPDLLRAAGLGSAELDFGPRGPQHRPGARI